MQIIIIIKEYNENILWKYAENNNNNKRAKFITNIKDK